MKYLSRFIPGFMIAALLLTMGLGLQAQTKKKSSSAAAAKTIAASGCVKAGVEAGCLVLTDFKTKKLYNLFFTGDKPAIDTAIHFTGTAHDGPTTCMQGQAVDVKKWTPLKRKCPAEKPVAK